MSTKKALPVIFIFSAKVSSLLSDNKQSNINKSIYLCHREMKRKRDAVPLVLVNMWSQLIWLARKRSSN